jgi:hypothetical protein
MLTTLLAQSSSGSSAAAGVALAGIFGGFILVWIVVALIALVFLIWWIILLIDCINRDFPDRNTWLAILIVGFLFGFIWLVDILYYFLVVKKYESKKPETKK